MPIVKLDATSSTNDFLKELAGNQDLENFMVVTTESQTSGRGQMGAKWHSEPYKNLIMSILIKNSISDIKDIYNLNVCVALSVFASLQSLRLPHISIKWPNDIMSGNKKIGGILIENVIKSSGEIISIAGIGLNVNQKDFAGLPQASSLTNILGEEINRDLLLEDITNHTAKNIHALQQHKSKLWDDYNKAIFRKGIPTAFEDATGAKFMGIIQSVLENGTLEVSLEDESIAAFSLREIKMLF